MLVYGSLLRPTKTWLWRVFKDESGIFLGSLAGLNLGGGMNTVQKTIGGNENFIDNLICEHCGMKSCTYVPMGHENFSKE